MADQFDQFGDFTVGTSPRSVAVGDFNGDGVPDLAVANYNSNTVSVLLGTGAGSFGTATNFTVGLRPRFVAVGDFNGDGAPDLAVANEGSNTVSVLLGTGTGSFAAATNFAVGSQPRSVAVGDFNDDDTPDLAVANYYDHSVSILLGTGTGHFGTATDFAVGNNPNSVAVGDFNGNGVPDLVVANNVSNNVSVLLGTGTGHFGTATDFAVGTAPNAVAVGDFNGDGIPDLAVAMGNSDTVSMLLGTGTGSFGTATNFAVGDYPQSVATGDFNGDSTLDLAVTNVSSNTVSVLLGTGTGSFAAATNFAVGSQPRSVAVGDFNGDGTLDLAVANYSSSTVSVLLGTGTGSFAAATNFAVGTGPYSVAVGDFNGDGTLDLAVTNVNSNTVSVLLGTGDGSFAAATNFVVRGQPYSVAVGDFNGDGTLDLAVTNLSSNTVSVLLNMCGVTLAQGTACLHDSDCASGFCVDGMCCDSACGGGLATDCQACSVALGAAVDGLCGPANLGRICRAAVSVCDPAETCDGSSLTCAADSFTPPGGQPGACSSARACNGAGSCARADGEACTIGSTCAGGFCIDGVCCNTPAGGCVQNTATPTQPTPTPRFSRTITKTPTHTLPPPITNTAGMTATKTRTRTPTATLTPTGPTHTPSHTPSVTLTQTSTLTSTPTFTWTPTATATPTRTKTNTPAGTSTRTAIPTPTCMGGTRRGVSFTGATQSVDGGTWNITGNQMTVALWAKVTALTPEAYPTLLSKWNNTDPGNAVFVLNTGTGIGQTRMLLFANDGTLVSCNTDNTDDTAKLVLNQWHHVAATLDGSTLRCYVDGVQTGTTGTWPAGKTIRQSAHHVRLGGRDDAKYLNGVLDDVRIYRRGLSAAEIAAIYNGCGGTCDNAAADLVAWWKLDDGAGTSAADGSGNSHTATLVNGAAWADAFVCCGAGPTATPINTSTPVPSPTPTLTPVGLPTCAAGAVRNGLAFSGTLTPPTTAPSVDTGTWNITGDQMTVALWANVTALTASPEAYPTFLSKWNNTDPANTVFVLNTGTGIGQTRMLIFADNGALVSCNTDRVANLVPNSWHHVAATLDGTTLRCYVDGVQVGTTGTWPAGRNIRQSWHHVRLGGRDDAKFLSGMLDDVRIYDRGLSAAEIAALYNGASGSCGNAAANLIAWWKLDDGSGTAAADSSGSGHTGTLVNGPIWSTGMVCCP